MAKEDELLLTDEEINKTQDDYDQFREDALEKFRIGAYNQEEYDAILENNPIERFVAKAQLSKLLKAGYRPPTETTVEQSAMLIEAWAKGNGYVKLPKGMSGAELISWYQKQCGY